MDPRNTAMMDDTNLHEVGDEDLESREKPKVTYICGGIESFTSLTLHNRLR
jgi:hypothetical protein